MFGIKILGFFVSESLWATIRRVCLHSSCFGFSMDFMHSVMGHHMVAAHFFMEYHEAIITWSALAAVIIVYIDDGFHKEKEHHAQDENGEWHPVDAAS